MCVPLCRHQQAPYTIPHQRKTGLRLHPCCCTMHPFIHPFHHPAHTQDPAACSFGSLFNGTAAKLPVPQPLSHRPQHRLPGCDRTPQRTAGVHGGLLRPLLHARAGAAVTRRRSGRSGAEGRCASRTTGASSTTLGHESSCAATPRSVACHPSGRCIKAAHARLSTTWVGVLCVAFDKHLQQMMSPGHCKGFIHVFYTMTARSTHGHCSKTCANFDSVEGRRARSLPQPPTPKLPSNRSPSTPVQNEHIAPTGDDVGLEFRN